MDALSFLIPSSWQAATILCVVAVVVSVKVYLDVRTSIRLYRLRLRVKSLVRGPSKRAVTVFVELGKRADNLFGLLDNLREQNYSKLDVVVLIKHTAGKNTQPQLANYRRRHGMKMSLVRYAKGMKSVDVIRRYAKGVFVLTLEPADRLSDGFLKGVNLDIMLAGEKSVYFPVLRQVEVTLASVFSAQESVWAKLSARLGADTPASKNQNGRTLISKQNLVRDTKPQKSVVSIKGEIKTSAAQNKVTWSVVLGIALTLGLGLVYSNFEDWSVVVLALSFIYIIVYVLTQLSVRSYSFMDGFVMALMAPFAVPHLIRRLASRA